LTDEGIYALVERHSSLERIHLSYCDQVSVRAITFLLNRLMRLTHLSLTGVTAFKTPELQSFCRPTPPVSGNRWLWMRLRALCPHSCVVDSLTGFQRAPTSFILRVFGPGRRVSAGLPQCPSRGEHYPGIRRRFDPPRVRFFRVEHHHPRHHRFSASYQLVPPRSVDPRTT
jgi:hypothetical protein